MKYLILFIVVLLCGCGLLPITDGQIEGVSTGAGNLTTMLTTPVANSFFPGAGSGVAGLLGGVVTLVTAGVLKSLQKKNTEKPCN